ncbi:MAG: response regulator [Rhodospirillales bacterium]|nr:MAG: response regulator [Rhodospirillales bacterium]
MTDARRMLVPDDAAFQKMIDEHLPPNRVTVSSAAEGEDLCRLPAEVDAGVVLLDGRMPGEDGPFLARNIPKGAGGQSSRSIRSMSSSLKPKWWPISWIRTWRTMWARSSPVSHQ